MTVVFEAGLGMSGVCWGLVAPGVDEFARTVVYDRAGYGRSTFDVAPRTLPRLASDLGVLLRSLDGPFVLVGHSWGGPIVRVLASRREFDVRGLVLVDPSDELDVPPTAGRMRLAGPVTRTLAGLGIYRLAARIGSALPDYAQFREECFSRRGARVYAAEVREFVPGLASLRAAPPSLGDLPVTILSAGAGPASLRAAHAASVAAAGGRLVVADGAGHNLMFERPALVVEEIRRLVSRR
ncbi:alpha/beta fold hydrolase [Cryptosporangium phraense]|uniref:alpha/beta fold hydrolase n=1 Tax=Cryptosporangium phraense TaxID=2593070 RepID=UPI00197AAC16|nr:alpha/beta hydrolase [Cryptosporangium phraense]